MPITLWPQTIECRSGSMSLTMMNDYAHSMMNDYTKRNKGNWAGGLQAHWDFLAYHTNRTMPING